MTLRASAEPATANVSRSGRRRGTATQNHGAGSNIRSDGGVAPPQRRGVEVERIVAELLRHAHDLGMPLDEPRIGPALGEVMKPVDHAARRGVVDRFHYLTEC